MTGERDAWRDIAEAMLDVRLSDRDEQLVSRDGLDDVDIDQVVRVMQSLRAWHETDRRMAEASRRYMKLNATDMRAVRFLIAARNQDKSVTPGQLADFLGISSASTTKLLDRLERGGHVVRAPHPTDRRALVISVSDDTGIVARESVGRQHARRFAAAAALSPDEREVVIRFLDALTATEADSA
ncbi:MarR family winged helix-turn-helix transcriptional regulator [Agromyces humatus]|uniref:MarR family winged helix-turn-helix transcriptional regulator n=1 Tax=Agromyces humatus TaxID=279573 RepID=A0ABN2KVH5_9MICO|nr:MarR family transcriptional regulator [Agromyces humatus]